LTICSEDLLKDKEKINIFTRGTSGIVLGSFLYLLIKPNRPLCQIYHCRKEEERSHDGNWSWDEFNPTYTENYNIIIDDDIASGNTVRAIHEKMKFATVDLLIVNHGYNNEIPCEVLITKEKFNEIPF
jgi:orotate phosphoribosyltransferase-like protein